MASWLRHGEEHRTPLIMWVEVHGEDYPVAGFTTDEARERATELFGDDWVEQLTQTQREFFNGTE